MGTRADFYLGRGRAARWLGSVAWDGYPDGIKPTTKSGDYGIPKDRAWADGPLFAATTEAEFLARLEDYWTGRDDVTRPEQGWPWPWADSSTTDYAYAFDAGAVWVSRFGRSWVQATAQGWTTENLDDHPKDAVFPDMTAVRRVTWGPRSGVMVFTTPKQE